MNIEQNHEVSGTLKRSRLTLRTKLGLFVCMNAFLGLLFVASGFSYILIQDRFQSKGQEALHIAQTVADIPRVIQAFSQPRPATVIQPLAEQIRRQVGAEFIVVANMHLIRYSHPNPQEVGKSMSENDGRVVLNGKSTISEATGTLGLSIRARVPLFDGSHHQIGIVSVGYLVSDIWRQITLSLMKVAGFSTVAFAFSLIAAHILSGNVKRLIFGMEPSEIAYLVQEQTAIMQAIQEGILAVDSRGYMMACNQQAKRILNLETAELLGKHLVDAVPYQRLCSVISDGPNYVDHPMIIGTTMIIVNRVPVLLNDEVIGSVITFRDKMQLDQMERRLEDIDKYADALRSQRHEFMNRLHTIAGLIQLQHYDLVRTLIDEINNEQNQLLASFSSRIRDPAVFAIIIGKLHRARELGIQLSISEKSTLSMNTLHREVVVTVLGNAIDNALEALAAQGLEDRGSSKITVLISDEADDVVLSVTDTGPGIDPQLGNRIFEDGVSTKGPGRGFGLSFCSQLVARAGGSLSVLSSPDGAALEMVLPKGERISVVGTGV